MVKTKQLLLVCLVHLIVCVCMWCVCVCVCVCGMVLVAKMVCNWVRPYSPQVTVKQPQKPPYMWHMVSACGRFGYTHGNLILISGISVDLRVLCHHI